MASARDLMTDRSLASRQSSYTLVDRVDEIGPAVAKLRATVEGEAAAPMAVDCEGETLSRRGKLSLLAVGTEEHTFLFDILELGGERAFKAGTGLRELLEDEDRQKVMFDCREDSDCLWHNHGVKLANVLDLQLLQVIYKENTSSRYCSPGFQPMLSGLGKCLQLYISDARMTRAKDAGRARLSCDSAVFMKRPLDDVLLAYTAVDVWGACALYRWLWPKVQSPGDRDNVRAGSRRYLALQRGRTLRLYDKYERNHFLPWGVLDLPAYGHDASSAGDAAECRGCRRWLPRQVLRGNRGISKCPVCRKVDTGR